MDPLSAYQQMRRANLGENRQFLTDYGLQAPVSETSSVVVEETKPEKKKSTSKGVKKPRSVKPKAPEVERRTSFRIRLRVRHDQFEDYESLKDSDEEADEDEDELLQNLRRPQKGPRAPRPNSYGFIEGVRVGTWWETRLECNYDGIHRPTVAGIHPGPDGAYSVALSGGYEDDVDLGDSFTYTGEGGRDLKGTVNKPKNLRTAPQSKHQTLERGNLALSRNVETGNPVRVIRGYKLRSRFAPEKGYRYDGLYKVARYWEAVGQAGYRVYKFDFQRCDPEPAPWHKISPKRKQSRDERESISLKDDDNSCKMATKISRDEFGSLENLDKSPKTPEKDERKTMFFELTPGKRTPVKVANSVDNLRSCSISCSDFGWHGWEDMCALPHIDCLSIECEGNVEHVKCIDDGWKVVTKSYCKYSPFGSTTTFEDSRRHEGISNKVPTKASEYLSSPEASRAMKKNVESSVESHINDMNEHWLGWGKQLEPANSDALSIDFEGNIVRIIFREGKWQEIDGSDPMSLSHKLSDPTKEDTSCDWAGWPEGRISVLDCPSTFNCKLIEFE